MQQNLITLQDAINKFKKLIEDSIITGGNKGKTAMIRSSVPILNLHEAVKTELIKAGINATRICPPLKSRTPELKLAGSMKQKDQDVCVVPEKIMPQKEIMQGGLLNNIIDIYGEAYTERILCINVRSQISSIQKNFDTLYERTFSEAINLHDRCPKMCLGEVYMIAIPEYNDRYFDQNTVQFKMRDANIVEKYIKSFQAINNRKNTEKNFYQYERACLLIVDFSVTPPKIYNSDQELIADGLLSAGTAVSYSGLSFSDFANDLISLYNERF